MSKEIRVQEVAGKEGKTVAARIFPGTDLIEGIIEVCKKNNITYGYIPTCFGSFEKAGFMYLVPQKKAKIGAGYGDVIVVEGPVEFLGGVGVICQNDGKYDLHFHATMCDETGRLFGGHIVAGRNPVLTTVDVVIVEIQDVALIRKYDEETDLTQFSPEEV